MNCYKIDVRLRGTVRVEDPKCPAGWRGSGCYDIDVDATQDALVYVVAESKGEAFCLVTDFDYLGERMCELEDIEVISILGMEEIKEVDEEEGGEARVYDVSFDQSMKA